MKKEIILQPEIKYTAVGYTQPVVIDNPIDKTVTAKFNLISDDGQVYDFPSQVIWQGDEYDKIGQWTDEDLLKQIDILLT